MSRFNLTLGVIALIVCANSGYASDAKLDFCKRNPGGLKPNPTELNGKAYAGIGEYPWAVGIMNNDKMTCAGSLILPQVVVTAAHCTNLLDVTKAPVNIKAGLWAQEKDAEGYPSQVRKVKEILQHPDYKFDKTEMSNDISLLFLEEPVVLSQAVNIICLPDKTDVVDHTGVTCFGTGWGIEESEGKLSPYPKNISMPLMEGKVCEEKLRLVSALTPEYKLDKTSLCAGGKDGIDTCTGDGGSSLACDAKDNKVTLTGLTSWGVGCKSNNPGVYTRVASFVDWINDNVQKKGFNSTMYTL